MPTAAILGSGRVGSVIARDLAGDEEFSVRLVDADADALRRAVVGCPRIAAVHADLRDEPQLREAVAGAEVVAAALPSAMGYQALARLINMGVAVVDISFFDADPAPLDERAKQTGAKVIYDIGVAPGMSNILAAEAVASLERCSRLDIVVGGVPKDPKPPFHYKAAFSPADVLEEYTRPARVVEGGSLVEKTALSEEEMVEFARFGVYSAVLTDGLRSLATSLDVPTMREKTLRDPRHVPLMRALRDGGFFSKDEIALPTGACVRPRDLAEAILFPHWKYEQGEADLTLMRIVAQGERDSQPATIVWELLDEYNARAATTSMARTTAFPAAVAARLLAEGVIDRAGVHPPEALASVPGALDRLLDDQRARSVVYTRRDEQPPRN